MRVSRPPFIRATTESPLFICTTSHTRIRGNDVLGGGAIVGKLTAPCSVRWVATSFARSTSNRAVKRLDNTKKHPHRHYTPTRHHILKMIFRHFLASFVSFASSAPWPRSILAAYVETSTTMMSTLCLSSSPPRSHTLSMLILETSDRICASMVDFFRSVSASFSTTLCVSIAISSFVFSASIWFCFVSSSLSLALALVLCCCRCLLLLLLLSGKAQLRSS